MTPAVHQDITISRRGSFSMVVTALDANEDPLDLTGYVGQMQIRLDPTDADPVATATVTIDTVTGEVAATFTPLQTTDMDWTTGLYDLRVVSGTGQTILYLAEGKATPEDTITR